MAAFHDNQVQRAPRSGSSRSARQNPRRTGGSRSRTPRKGVLATILSNPVGVGAGVIALLVAIWLIRLISGTFFGVKQESLSREEITANVQTLAVMEQQTPPDISALNEEATQASTLAENSTVVEMESPDEEEQRIMTMEKPSMSTLLEWFDGCAIVGDSIVEGVAAYQFLNSSIVFGKIGCSVAGADDLITSMEAVHPRKVFLCFGLNDMANYGSEVDKFIDHYKTLIEKVREDLPTTGIYVVAVLPVQEKAINKQPKLGNVDLYNERMETMAEELDVAFLDPGFILEQDPSFFDQDGMHPKGNFYYKWLTYLADMAGISE